MTGRLIAVKGVDEVYQRSSWETVLTLEDDRVASLEGAQASFVLFREFGEANAVSLDHTDGITFSGLSATVTVPYTAMDIEAGLYYQQLVIEAGSYQQTFLLDTRIRVLPVQDV